MLFFKAYLFRIRFIIFNFLKGPSETVVYEEENLEVTTTQATRSVQTPQLEPSIQILHNNVKVERIGKTAGQDLVLACQLTNLPEIYSWKNGIGNVLASTKTLTLNDINTKQSGYISCDNSEMKAYVYVDYLVPSSPSVTTKSPEGKMPFVHIRSLNVGGSLKENSQIKFACIVSDSEAIVDFKRSDGIMSQDVVFDNNVLTFNVFERKDAGEYVCTARNNYGEHSDRILITKEMDGSYNYKSTNNMDDSISVSVNGEVREGGYVELNPELTKGFSNRRRMRRMLPTVVDYYTWIRYPSLPKSAVTTADGRFFIQQFNEPADNGLYFVRATLGDSHLYGSKLIVSNSYLLSDDNPFFMIEKEDEDQLVVRCRPCKFKLKYLHKI